jgi:hypothetical protein
MIKQKLIFFANSMANTIYILFFEKNVTDAIFILGSAGIVKELVYDTSSLN